MLKSSRGQAQRRTQMRGLPIWLPLMLFCVVTACVEINPPTGPLGVFISVSRFKFRKCDLGLLFLLNHTKTLFLST